MGVRAAHQLFVVGLALALWSTLGRPGWVEWLGCYLGALCLTDLATALRLWPDLPARSLLVFGMVLALPGVRFAYQTREDMAEQAGWAVLRERTRDRVRLERLPSIAPGLISTALPQTFFVHAPGSSSVSVRLDPQLAPLATEPLGQGLFRLDYDPRRDGSPALVDGDLSITIRADKQTYARTVRVVTPLAHPRWFCQSPSGQRAATTSLETDELIVVDGTLTRIPVGDGPIDCAFVDEHTIAVSHRYAPELWLVDISAMPAATRKRRLTGPLARLCFDNAHDELLIARVGPHPAIVRVTTPALDVQTATALRAPADWLGLFNEELIVATRADASLLAMRREEDHFIETRRLRLGRPATALAIDRALGRVFVTVTDYHPDMSPQLGNHFVQDQLLVVDPRTLSVSQRVLTARRSEQQTKPGDMDQGGSPLGLWPLRDGRLAMAFAGTDELWWLRLPEAEPESLHFEQERFFTPHGVVELADGSIWLASPAAGSLARWTPRTRQLRVIALTPGDRALAKHRPAALARRIGERGFYESTRSGIACQSCHMHADSDSAAYNLGDHRLVPTLSVRGLFATSPYLRDGSYPRIGDLDEVAQTLYRGYPRPQPGRRYTLQAYVESLPREPAFTVRVRAAERRGYAVFQRAGCARCHSPPAFTNLGQLPLAALFPRVAATVNKTEMLDVPSLLSVGASAPYLYDGRARTLRAVLEEHNPDNLHGDTRELSPADRSDLVQFLGSL